MDAVKKLLQFVRFSHSCSLCLLFIYTSTIARSAAQRAGI